MNQDKIDKATALIAAGIDDDTIIEMLNISLNQLERLKNGGEQATEVTPSRQDRAYKITEDRFNELKAKFATWNGTSHAFQKANDLSTATFYRIKQANSYADYKGFIKASVSTTAKAKEGKAQAFKITADKYKELKEAQRMKGGLTCKNFCKLHDISRPTYYRIKNADSYDEYCGRRKKYVPVEQTVGVFHEPKGNGDFDIKVEQSPKESQDEVLKRIADSLDTISYKLHILIENQADTKKRGWFRK